MTWPKAWTCPWMVSVERSDRGEQDVDVDPADRVDRVDVLAREQPDRIPTANAVSATMLKFT
jgi:hypothetical protein